jgi:hypothetical protein
MDNIAASLDRIRFVPLGGILGGADAVYGSIADSRSGRLFSSFPEIAPSVQNVPLWWNGLPTPATRTRIGGA